MATGSIGIYAGTGLLSSMPAVGAAYFAGLAPNGLVTLAIVMAIWTLCLGRYLELRTRRLTDAVAKIIEGDDAGRMPDRLGGPAGAVASALNNLLDKAEVTNQSLAQQRAFFETMFQHVPGALVITDEHGRIVMTNPSVEKSFGYTPDELIDQPVGLLFADATELSQAGGEPFGTPMGPNDGPRLVSMLHKQGWQFKAEFIGTSATTPEGEVLAYLGHVRDVSHHQRTEDLLSRHRQVLESLVRGDPLAQVLESIVAAAENFKPEMICSIMMLDADGQRLRLGAAPSLPDFYNEAIDGLVIGADVGSCGSSAYWGKGVHVEDVMTHPYWGSFRDLAAEAKLRACWSEPIKGADGTVLGTFAIYYHQPRSPNDQDLEFIASMTSLAGLALDRARNERSLSEKHSSLQLLELTATSANEARSVSDALYACAAGVTGLLDFEFGRISVLDTKLLKPGDLDSRFVVAPSAAGLESQLSQLPDFPQATLATLPARSPHWISDLAAELGPLYEEVLREAGLSAALVVPLGDPQAPTALLEFYGRAPKGSREQLVDLMLGVSDQLTRVIERQRAERTLVDANHRSEQAARAKSEFVANMSHEIRTPMNGVIGMTSLLADSELTLEQRECVDTIRRCADGLVGIVNDVLDFSKVEAGKLVLEPLQFDLSALVAEVTQLVQPWAREKGLAFDARFSPDAPRNLIGDPGRIRQILMNLAGNAIKFTESGRILLKVDDIGSSGDQAYLKISITDTGPGIPKETVGTLFEKFVQADGSTTRNFGGTGLGLAISKQLTELMGGEIGVETGEGIGSTFWFTIALPARQTTRLPAEGFAGTRVLVLKGEGEPTRELLDLMFRWSLSVSEADSVERAAQLLRSARSAAKSFQILLVQNRDREAIEALREVCSDVNAAIVIVSEDGTDAPTGIRCLSTPVQQSSLLDMIATVWETLDVHDEPNSPVTVLPTDAGGSNDASNHAGSEGELDGDEGEERQPRVLVAEDNLVNQKVAAGMLSRLGCRVTIAENGQDALDWLERAPFDLVFMDCQMPEMDGYRATEEIRRREKEGRWTQWRGHMPIVAMTANAMQGDREKCLDSGMDDYLSKPAKSDQLESMLVQWARKETPAASLHALASDPAQLAPAASPINLETVETLREVVETGFVEIVDHYLEDTEQHLAKMKQAVNNNSHKELHAIAHQLKSTSGSLGALELANLALEAEALGRAGRSDQGVELVANMCAEFERVRSALEYLAGQPASGPSARKIA